MIVLAGEIVGLQKLWVIVIVVTKIVFAVMTILQHVCIVFEMLRKNLVWIFWC